MTILKLWFHRAGAMDKEIVYIMSSELTISDDLFIFNVQTQYSCIFEHQIVSDNGSIC